MDYSKYLKGIEERNNFYLCGMDIISFGVKEYLEKQGKRVLGIIDKTVSKPMDMFGTKMYPISWIEEKKIQNSGFIITAFKENHRKQYAELIEKIYGKDDYKIVANATEIRIDISGVCNLRCPSCQVGNHSEKDFQYAGRGFMNLPTFEKILSKIHKEIPDNPAIYLFSLGEPLLNNNLPGMIEKIHEYGWLSIVSSNLSLECDLEQIMKANPDVLKISVSGYTQEVYETTHKGGNVERVKENMRKIRKYMDVYQLKTKVMVGYHLYNNNRDSEYDNMKKLAQELGFLFEPVEAMYFNMFKRTGYTPYSEEDKHFIQTYYPAPERILNIQKPDEITGKICRNKRDKFFVDYNGNVLLCELFHHEAIYKNFMNVSYEVAQEWREEHWICQRCKAYNMHLH